MKNLELKAINGTANSSTLRSASFTLTKVSVASVPAQDYTFKKLACMTKVLPRRNSVCVCVSLFFVYIPQFLLINQLQHAALDFCLCHISSQQKALTLLWSCTHGHPHRHSFNPEQWRQWQRRAWRRKCRLKKGTVWLRLSLPWEPPCVSIGLGNDKMTDWELCQRKHPHTHSSPFVILPTYSHTICQQPSASLLYTFIKYFLSLLPSPLCFPTLVCRPHGLHSLALTSQPPHSAIYLFSFSLLLIIWPILFGFLFHSASEALLLQMLNVQIGWFEF